MIERDNFSMVDFVVNLPFEQADGWFNDRMPGGKINSFYDELSGRLPKAEETILQGVLSQCSWAHRYIRLSDNRTEVQIWFRTDSYISWLMDRHLIHAGERFPEAQADLCKAVADEEIAGLLPGLREICNEWQALGQITWACTSSTVTEGLYQNLIEILSDRYSIEELKDLSQKLGVDYEEFPLDRKPSLVRELVRYCVRHRKLKDIVAVGSRTRPDIEWPQVIT